MTETPLHASEHEEPVSPAARAPRRAAGALWALIVFASLAGASCAAGGAGTGGSGNAGGSGGGSVIAGTGGAGTGGASSSSAASSSGMGMPCQTSKDCPAPPGPCVQAICSGGVCGTLNTPSGTVVSAEPNGDCHHDVCDGAGQVATTASDTDVSDDGNACTADGCTNGVATHLPMAPGAPCAQAGGKVCDGAGSCVLCVVDLDCGAGMVCSAHVCAAVPASCTNGNKDGQESDKDCGGTVCPKCAAGLKCNVAADCQSGVCALGVCVTAGCTDGIKNGQETDIDCGGPSCAPCADGQHCLTGGDCNSEVCAATLCQMPTCSDGAKNGNETDKDCGGGACPACVAGKKCKVNGDCQSMMCVNQVCG